jgi:hypothetical protein
VKRALIWTGVCATLTGLVLWVASNTHWVDVPVLSPLKGEALVNPFYAVQRFADGLGARTAWQRRWTEPPPDAVVVLSAWNWGVSATRRQAIERWVESGGRLIVDSTLTGGEDDFERWSGIVVEVRDVDADKRLAEAESYEQCRRFEEVGGADPAARYTMCDFAELTHVTTDRPVGWALRDPTGMQALRVAVGRGSVTVINAAPFRYRNLFDGDHGWLFVSASQLSREHQVFFLSEEAHASLVTLIWRHGAPVVILTLAAVGLMLWRGGVRLGPLAAPPLPARRSLAEQIRGTGQFLVRHGGAESLHAAAVRALDEAAEARVRGYRRGTAQERADTLARLTGFDAGALSEAIYHPRMRRPHELRRTIALLEAARRLTLTERRRSPHVRH